MTSKQTTIAAAVSAALFTLAAPALWAQQAAPVSGAAPAGDGAQAGKDARAAAKEEAITSVVVTASKRSEQASKVPYNVSAISEEALRRENITDAKRLITESVNISAPGNGARFTDSVTVRGLNVSPVDANNVEQFVRTTLAYYLDDTALPFMSYRIKDIARVETLLGPQGTLYGSGSLGGTVRYITNQPKLSSNELRVNTSIYQTRNGGVSNDTDLVVNLPLGERLALRASLARLDEKGYTDRVSNPPWNINNGAGTWSSKPNPNQNLYEDDDWQKVNGGRLALLWRLHKDLSLTYAHTQQNQLAHGSSGVSLLPIGIANAHTDAEKLAVWNDDRYGEQCGPAGATPCATYTNPFKTPFAVNGHTILSRYDEFSDRKFKLDSLDLDWDLGFARLHSATSYFTDKRRGQADYTDKGHVFYYLLGDSGAKISSGRSAYMSFDNRYSGLSHETRLTSAASGPLSWIAGVFHTRTKRSLGFSEMMDGLDAYNDIARAAKGGRVDEGYAENLSSDYTESALFGEAGYRFADKWLLTVGGRVFKYEDTASAMVKDYTYDLVDSNRSNTTSDSGQSYYKLNLSYQFTDKLLGYATASQGYRRGGVNGFRDFGANLITKRGNEYAPDSTFNKELGLKGTLLGRMLYLEADVYRIEWRDTQTYRSQTVENGFPINGTANGPKAHTQGLELNARLKLGPNWMLSYAAATNKGQFDETRTHCLYDNTKDCTTWYAGDRLGGGAKWKHNAGLRYSSYLDNGAYLSAGLSGRYVGSVLSNRDTNGVPPTIFPSYSIFNANVALSKDEWELGLWVRNLANSDAQVSSQPIGITGARPINAQPRTVGMNLSYQFY